MKRRTLAVLAIAVTFLCLLVALLIWRAERSLRDSERDFAARQQLPVSVRLLVSQPNPGFEALSVPALFRSAAVYKGHFYLAGPTGLFSYSTSGVLEHIDRVGLDLPAAPLGQMMVGTVAESREPELLIATAGQGVLAFDGQRFRQIYPNDPDSRNITALLLLDSGRLLLGTAKRGLLVYNGSTLQRFHATTNDVYVTAIAGTEADVWIGTINRGVLHWRGGQTEVFGEAQGLPDQRVETIALAGGMAYAGTAAGVAELQDGKVQRILAGGRYAHALVAERDAIFIGQMDGTVLRVATSEAVDPNALHRSIAIHSGELDELKHRDVINSPVEQFLKVGESRYAVTGDQILHLEPGGEWRKVLGTNDSLLTDRDISAIMIGSDGRVWIGYFDSGLDIIPATGGRPVHVENEQVFCVNRIAENPAQGIIAVATANGLVLFDRDGRQKQVLTRDSGLIANHVTDVALYRDGMVAATPAGITFLDASGPHSMYAFQGLVNNHVYTLAARGKGLLVGTLGGLSLLTDGAVQRNMTTANSGLKANWITASAPAGEDWLAGTYGAGVLRIDAAGDVDRTEATILGAIVNPGAMASDGRITLAGTLGRGLLVGDAAGTRWKTVTAGLPSLNVTALAIANGEVYVGTDNGLVKIAEGKL